MYVFNSRIFSIKSLLPQLLIYDLDAGFVIQENPNCFISSSKLHSYHHSTIRPLLIRKSVKSLIRADFLVGGMPKNSPV